MNQNPAESQQQQPAPQEESIFKEEDLIDDRYLKQVRRARNTIYVVAAIEFVVGSIMAFAGPQEEIAISFGATAVVSLIFLGLAIWAGKNPYPAILVALILYVGLNVLTVVVDMISIAKGIIIKVIIVIYLVKGLNNARDAKRIKDALGTR